MNEQAIYEDFERRGIAFEKLEHPAVHTVEESAAIHEALPAAHTKNLFLKDKQGRFWLVTLRHDDLRQLGPCPDRRRSHWSSDRRR
ncbi:YbaK/EbsC family protein [Novosphingobium sp. fls2-241-R2A-195]|uniref:YbaK/EbsC family protein n=1 Tax=Novosphingobium sp. fls2-241-R2A-195 TaxID=3040296 RepID=UPI0033064204